MTNHVDDLTLARFAEGKLRREEIPPVLAHVEQCARCTEALAAASEAIEEVSGGATAHGIRPWLMAVAAILAVIAIAIPIMRRRDADGISRLVALAPRDARVLAPRVSGGFAWAAWRGPMRAEDSDVQKTKLRLAGATADAIDRNDREHTAASEHAAGIALLLIEKPLEAGQHLDAATKLDARDPALWSDLAAARIAAADKLARPSLLPRALAAADRALELDAHHGEALFNRALIVEAMGLSTEARAAWDAYLAVDNASDWAREAREHLAQLPPPAQSQFERDQPRLERAAAAHDTNTIASIVAADPLRARTFGETWYLGHWAMALQRGDASSAEHELATARALGDALAARSGESLLRDSVRAIDAAPASLIDAHALYYRGRLAYSRQKPADAQRDLLAASHAFGASPMALAARYYAANTRYDEGGVTDARRALEALLAETDARYGALRAQIRWQLALCHMVGGDWDATLPHLTAAETEFTRLGERGHAAFIETLLADAYASLGRTDDAWSARIRAFRTLSADALGDRLPVSLGEAARMELRGGDREAALPLLRLEEAATRRAQRDPLLSNALVRIAVLRSALGETDMAAAAARDAESVAARIDDASLRERAMADVHFAQGAVAVQSDPRHARELLDRAIDVYRARELTAFLPEAYLLRARAGEGEEAMLDIDAGLAALQRHRVRIAESVVGTGVLDAGRALFEEAIRLRLDREDAAGALAYAERARLHIGETRAFDLDALQRRLGRAIVVEYVALPRELVAFAIRGDGVRVSRTPIDRGQLATTVARGDASELYELLVRKPIEDANELIVIPDPLLATVPFAALTDRATRRPLVERVSIAIAPSAAALQDVNVAAAPRTLLAVTLPAEGAANALPASGREADEVAALYPQANALRDVTFAAFQDAARLADVVHVTGHTAREAGAGDSALVFASGERVSWQTLASSHFAPSATVVLAACETLRPSSAHALSLGDAALAAGAASVIGTLTPIPDRDAREIFGAVHRHLAGGSCAAEAVRLAQLETRNRVASWRAVAVVTTRIH